MRAVLEHAVGDETAAPGSPVFAGDIVPAKKPAPAIYLLAVRAARRRPGRHARGRGLAQRPAGRASAPGCRCLVTVNGYTGDEDFTEAALVVSSSATRGEPPIEVLANRGRADPGDYVTLDDLRACIAAQPTPSSQQRRRRAA